jgi:hypothetical protein
MQKLRRFAQPNVSVSHKGLFIFLGVFVLILLIGVPILLAFLGAIPNCTLHDKLNKKCKNDEDCCGNETKCRSDTCLRVTSQKCSKSNECYTNNCKDNKCVAPTPSPTPSSTPGPSPTPSPTPGPSPTPSPTPGPSPTPSPQCPSDDRCPIPHDTNNCRVICADIHPTIGEHYGVNYRNHSRENCNVENISSVSCKNHGGIKNPPEDNIIWCEKCDE